MGLTVVTDVRDDDDAVLQEEVQSHCRISVHVCMVLVLESVRVERLCVCGARARACVCMWVCWGVCLGVCICVRTHTHTHAHTCTCERWRHKT